MRKLLLFGNLKVYFVRKETGKNNAGNVCEFNDIFRLFMEICRFALKDGKKLSCFSLYRFNIKCR